MFPESPTPVMRLLKMLSQRSIDILIIATSMVCFFLIRLMCVQLLIELKNIYTLACTTLNSPQLWRRLCALIFWLSSCAVIFIREYPLNTAISLRFWLQFLPFLKIGMTATTATSSTVKIYWTLTCQALGQPLYISYTPSHMFHLSIITCGA